MVKFREGINTDNLNSEKNIMSECMDLRQKTDCVCVVNPYLSKCKIKETELCSFCNEAKETYEHFVGTVM